MVKFTGSSQNSFDTKFLDRYDNLTFLIKRNTPCYAVSAEWWFTFKYIVDEMRDNPGVIMGDPGPIKNLSNIEEKYKQDVLGYSAGQAPDESKLSQLTDWDKMQLKKNLKYNDDFVLVSQQVWSCLLNCFGGGPEIELIPQKCEDLNVAELFLSFITYTKEHLLAKDVCIDMEVQKVYYIRDQDDSTVRACYVSLNASAKTFFEGVTRKMMSPLYKCSVSVLDEENNFLELKDYGSKTLAELGVQESSILDFSFSMGGGLLDGLKESTAKYHELSDEPSKAKYYDEVYGPSAPSNRDYNKEEQDYGDSKSFPGLRDSSVIDNNKSLLQIQEKKWKIDFEKLSTINKQVQQTTAHNSKLSLQYKPFKMIRNDIKVLQFEWLRGLKELSALRIKPKRPLA